MARLPVPGGDQGKWGAVLNEFLNVEHNADGTLSNVARPSDLNDIKDTIAPLASGFTDQQLLSPDGSSLMWFNSPALISSWAPYKIANTGSADAGPALQSFFDAVAVSGKPGILLPGVYRTDQILDISSNSVLYMQGVEIRNYNTSLGSGGYGNTVPVLRIVEANNVLIEGGTINGRNSVGGFGANEHKHGITISGGSNITLRDIKITDCKGDGVYIEPSVGVAPVNLVMERVRSDANYRQGMSVLSLDGGRFSDCDFTNTDGTNPQSGVNLEPEENTLILRDLVFSRCRFNGNTGSGFVVSFKDSATTVQRDISLVDCTIRGNGQWGLWLTNAAAFTARNTKIQNNTASQGVWILGGANEDITLDGCHITGNGDNGILVSGLATALSVKGLKVINCVIGQNSARANNNFAGIRFDGSTHSLGATDVLIQGNAIGRSGGTTQVYGIGWGTGVTYDRVRLIDNDFSEGNTLRNYDFVATATAVPAVVTQRDNTGWATRSAGVTSVADAGTIPHGLVGTPTRYGATATTADEFVSVSAVSGSNLTIQITRHDGTAGTTANVAWWAEI